MKTVLLALLLALSFPRAAILQAHHGPGMRGYNEAQTVVISGVITKCVGASQRRNPDV